jgi:hypothetical protein
MRTMPAFIFQRYRHIELDGDFIFAGQLVVDIPKGEKLKPSLERRIQYIIECLLHMVQDGEMPEDAFLWGWPGATGLADGDPPPDAQEIIEDDALIAAWAKDRLLIAVNVDHLDSDIMWQMGMVGMAPDGGLIN